MLNFNCSFLIEVQICGILKASEFFENLCKPGIRFVSSNWIICFPEFSSLLKSGKQAFLLVRKELRKCEKLFN
jgi:hypothetical protein